MRPVIRVIIVLLCTLLVGPDRVVAQADISSFFLTGTWQAAQLNPARLPTKGGWLVNLPGFYTDALVTNLTYNDLVGAGANGENVLRIDNAISQLEERNIIRQRLDLESIGVSFGGQRLAVSLGHRLRYDAFMDYPRTLPQLIWQGNNQFVGQTIDFAPDLQLTGYHEFSVGLALSLGEALQLGGRLKWLSGIANVATERSQLLLTTDDAAYALTLEPDFRVSTSGALRYNGFQDIGVNFDFGQWQADKLFTQNNGLAFDLGASISLGNVQLYASVLDLGSGIRWEEEVRNYSVVGTRQFSGLDVAQQFLDDSTSFGSVIDTLEQIYSPTETNEAYTTALGTQIYLGGTLAVSDQLELGALLFWESYRTQRQPALALSGAYQLNSLLRIGATAAYRDPEVVQLGVNALVSLGPARLLVATNNVLTALRPRDSHQADLRVGLNLVFGE